MIPEPRLRRRPFVFQPLARGELTAPAATTHHPPPTTSTNQILLYVLNARPCATRATSLSTSPRTRSTACRPRCRLLCCHGPRRCPPITTIASFQRRGAQVTIAGPAEGVAKCKGAIRDICTKKYSALTHPGVTHAEFKVRVTVRPRPSRGRKKQKQQHHHPSAQGGGNRPPPQVRVAHINRPPVGRRVLMITQLLPHFGCHNSTVSTFFCLS